MSRIKVRLIKGNTVNVRLKPKNGVKVRTNTTYLYDPTLIEGAVDLAEDWATKTDGMVEEDGVPVDYSAKAHAIGGTGTETNNAKYYAEQAGTSATSASDSATTATAQAGIATTQAGIAITKAGEAATSESNALTYSQNAATSAGNAYTSESNAHASELAASSSADDAEGFSITAGEKATEASGYATSASTSATNAGVSANNAQTWAEGTDEQVSVLGGEKSSKGWADRAKEIAEGIGSIYKPAGSIAFESLPALSSDIQGNVYNITNDFTTTSDFVEGAGKSYPAGTNVVCIDIGSGVYKWDVLAGIVDLSGYVPTSRTVNGKALSSDISLNASDVGAQPAGNYMTTDTVQAVGAGATKTFNGRVNFVGTGDANAIYLSTDTRIDVYGTSRTVLGFANGTFLINNAAYPLNLRGSGARPAWNGTSYLALTSDIGNATLTIQKNGVAVDTFNANATSDKTINITVPTVNNPTITLTQGGVTKGSFTLNQSSDGTIALDAGGGGSVKTFDLFDHKWSDYQLNDQSWLRADTFSWQPGETYSEAYNHLVEDYINGTRTLVPEGAGIWCYIAPDGHRIVDASDTTQVTNVENLYNSTGVAWYYVLDTTNQKFKLPRTKFGFTGLRDTVGKYVPESLPNITGNINTISNNGDPSATGCFVYNTNGVSGKARIDTTSSSSGSLANIGVDASRSSSTYQDDAPVQQRATQMYLYFYVGQFSQSAIEQTAGLNTELFNDKLDLDLGNISNVSKETIVMWGIPDYTAGVSKSTSGFTADKNGLVKVRVLVNNSTRTVYVNGVNVLVIGIAATQNLDVSGMFSVKAGDVITVSNASGISSIVFYPFLGV